MKSSHRIFFVAGIALVAIQIIQAFFRGYNEHWILALGYPLIVAPFSFWHGILRYGWRDMIIFFIMIFSVGWIFESLSVATGFPFGNYYYTDVLGYKLGQVPISVMPGYFSFGYISWVLADVMIGKRDNSIRGWEWITIPLIASFFMSAWDLFTDPINSTFRPMWVWEEGGSYFGVPISNFLGWCFVVFVFYTLFAFYNRWRNNDKPAPEITKYKWYWLLPIIMYFSSMLEVITAYLWRDNVLMTSLEGHEWWSKDMFGSMILVALWTILPYSAYALWRLNKDFKADK